MSEIRSIAERLARLLEAQAEIAEDIRELKAEAKSSGIDATLLTKVAKLMIADEVKRRKALDQHDLFDIYLSACGLGTVYPDEPDAFPFGGSDGADPFDAAPPRPATINTDPPAGLQPGRKEEPHSFPSAQDDTDGNQGEAAPVGRQTVGGSAGSDPVHHAAEVSQVVTLPISAPVCASSASGTAAGAVSPPAPAAPAAISSARPSRHDDIAIPDFLRRTPLPKSAPVSLPDGAAAAGASPTSLAPAAPDLEVV